MSEANGGNEEGRSLVTQRRPQKGLAGVTPGETYDLACMSLFASQCKCVPGVTLYWQGTAIGSWTARKSHLQLRTKAATMPSLSACRTATLCRSISEKPIVCATAYLATSAGRKRHVTASPTRWRTHKSEMRRAPPKNAI